MQRTHSFRRAEIRDGTTVDQLILTYPPLTEAEEVFKAHVYTQNKILRRSKDTLGLVNCSYLLLKSNSTFKLYGEP